MSYSETSQRPNIREEAKLYYRDRNNISNKWLDQYGNVSRDNDYQRNRACLGEIFNMLDVVMDICIEDFRHSHIILSIDMVGKTPVYTFALNEDDPARPSSEEKPGVSATDSLRGHITFSMPTTFARRVRTLRSIGYPISNELLYDTRLLRNDTTHGNQTIVLQHMELGYEETMKALLSIADALICLGMLDPSLRTPSFDMLRVKEGDTLMGGIYTIGTLVGEGGMSRVYKAEQKRTGKILAIKEFKPDTYSDAVIRQECDAMFRIQHPAVPQIYDTFYENGTFYIVMDYIDGVSLDRYAMSIGITEISAESSSYAHSISTPLKIRPLLTRDARDSVLRGLCDVLSYLHSEDVGLVFADLSPDNILVDKEGQPHLIDFGISSQKDERQHIPAATPGYSAPEVFSEKALDERTDIFSFGQILRLLYTGLSPLEQSEISAFDLIPDPVIAEVVERCTARSPLERYASIEEVRGILFPMETGSESSRMIPLRYRRFIIAGGIAAALSVTALAGYAGVLRHRSAEMENAIMSVSDTSLITMEEAGVKDHVIEWKDKGLERGIRDEQSLDGEKIRLSDLWEVENLNLSGYEIQNIEDLSDLRNLKILVLDNNEISDLTPLSSLTNLQELSLGNNLITDIQPLALLENLRGLDLRDNQIADSSVLGSLSGLRQLRLDGNPIDPVDFTWIGSLSDLNSVYLCNLRIEDCSFLQNNTALTDLALSENMISDLSPLLMLNNLKSLYLGRNKLSSLEGISRLKNLEQLEIEGNPVGDLSPLKNLAKLSWLDAPDCKIHDLAPIEGLSLITSLDLNGNPIEDLSPLSHLTRLSYLDLSSTGLEGGLDELSQLTALKYLYLKDNQISDISALSGLRSLQYLQLSGNPIKDYSPVDELKLLERDF